MALKRKHKVLLSLSALLIISYLVGPKPKKPIYNEGLTKVPNLLDLDTYIKKNEAKHKIKPNNEAEIIWADTANKIQTEYAIVYLHGFSASKNEGNPIHLNLAKKLKANLFLSRLSDHGLDTTQALKNFTAERLWESSKEAYAIARKLGKKVIVIGTSTGGTLALKLASIYPEINSLILVSPNIAINDKFAFLLNNPWGLQIAQKVVGAEERTVPDKTEEQKKYWYTKYRLESVVELEEFVETTMTKAVFRKVKQPTLLLYYYKNEQEQDPVVRVDAMLKMFDQLSTPIDLKRKVDIPNAGAHVLGSYLTSNDIPSVEKAINSFVDDIVIKQK